MGSALPEPEEAVGGFSPTTNTLGLLLRARDRLGGRTELCAFPAAALARLSCRRVQLFRRLAAPPRLGSA